VAKLKDAKLQMQKFSSSANAHASILPLWYRGKII